MLHYETLSEEIEARLAEARGSGVRSPHYTSDASARRRRDEGDNSSAWRGPFLRDVDRILHCPFYNRYADKTQVFSLYENDDISRRALHVQLVSRIGRTLGAALGLNSDLIEAIALGHDIGHAPFGHAGEGVLSALLHAETGRYFYHNLQSVRVLDVIFPYNLTLETLSGIAGHNGENESPSYAPLPLADFRDFDDRLLAAACSPEGGRLLHPSTLEGCVVRIADILAYLGKDRQDAARAGIAGEESFAPSVIGSYNAEILHNMMVNIIEESFGRGELRMDGAHFAALSAAKDENYRQIYLTDEVRRSFEGTIAPMMERLYHRLLRDVREGRRESPIFTHHVAYVSAAHYPRPVPYEETEPNQLVVDYIASMTDDYFVALYRHLFGEVPAGALRRDYFA